ncbi:hypothetical protein SAMN03080598_00709 [Algoriphagus boritolerans DSM 17298 = JCM 18970]|uniref:Uncharacterized protein n=1 Tax=Algoriphagus boritolerans DSM 17298 = JCM 18970 TaxID=1120964 RepID=A0A1H5T5S9_9BACT|nr:hypothetical protein SAMN03080598_00709 [Algoriphagus boritolerans DSM 17298 = JCM 18970]
MKALVERECYLEKVRFDTVDLGQIVEYYADKEHPGLRIRRYYQGIGILKRGLNLNLVHYIPDYYKIYTFDFQVVKK